MNKSQYTCDKFRELLSSTPLYKELEINYKAATQPSILHDFGFPFECDCSPDPQTHLLKFDDKDLLRMSSVLPGKFHGEYWIEDKRELRFVEKCIGKCQSCKGEKAFFLLEFFTDGFSDTKVLFAKKIGQHPAFSIRPAPFIKKVLLKENLECYQKALMNLSANYGIGAFAYFRRIVENELLHLLEEVSKLNDGSSEKIAELLEAHKIKHNLSNLIEEVFKFLPDSLKGLGDNPFKLLYGTLSVGIHQLSEKECFEKATSLKFLLDFVLKKIYEEKNEVSAVRDHIKNLK